MVAAVICLIGYVLTTMAYARIYKVVKYHQNQIYSQNQIQNAQTREALRQRKSAYNSLFVSVVFLACYFPFFPCTILYMANTSEISFLIAQFASFFLICLNSSLNPLVYCWRYREIRQIVKKHIEENNSHEREHDLRRDLEFLDTKFSEKKQWTFCGQRPTKRAKGKRLMSSTTELVSLNRETKRHF